MPISNELQALISASIQKANVKGRYSDLDKKFNEVAFPGYTSYAEDTCNPDPLNTNDDRRLETGSKGAARVSGDSQGDGHFTKLGIDDMTAPIFISCFATTLALCVFLWREYSEPYFKVSRKGKRSNTESSGDMNKDGQLKAELMTMTAYELLATLRGLVDIDEDDIKQASDFLPDTSALAWLVFQQRCSQINRDLIYLRCLSALELFDILKQAINVEGALLKSYGNQPGSSSDLPSAANIINAANDVNDPKRVSRFLFLTWDVLLRKCMHSYLFYNF